MTTPPANDASKSDQPGENAPTFRVRTLGLRNADTDEQTVHDAIAARFKVSAGRARAIVKGRVVATDLKPGKARALKAELLKLGVVAKVENAQTVAEPLAKGATADLTGFLDGLSSRYSGHVQRDTKYKFMSAAMFAAAMLLPMTYLLVIVGLVIGTGAYAMAVPVKVSVGGVLLWITPIVVSLALLVFLARPLFMRVSRPTRVAIDPQSSLDYFHSKVFAVERILVTITAWRMVTLSMVSPTLKLSLAPDVHWKTGKWPRSRSSKFFVITLLMRLRSEAWQSLLR